MSGSTRATGWVVGTVVLVLALFAVTWFTLASPRLEATAETMLEVENTRAQNDLLELENARLAADFASLEAFKAEVAALRVQMPEDDRLSDFVRSVDALAAQHDVVVRELSPGAPAVFTLPAAAATATTTATDNAVDGVTAADADSDEADATDGDAPAPQPTAPTGPVVPEGLVTVPLIVKVVGTYDATTAFLQGLQTEIERLFLVTGVDAVRQTEAEETAGVPALADGDVELNVTGQLYVLQDVAPTPTAPAEEPAEEAPLPSSDRNPFEPLPGTVAD